MDVSDVPHLLGLNAAVVMPPEQEVEVRLGDLVVPYGRLAEHRPALSRLAIGVDYPHPVGGGRMALGRQYPAERVLGGAVWERLHHDPHVVYPRDVRVRVHVMRSAAEDDGLVRQVIVCPRRNEQPERLA